MPDTVVLTIRHREFIRGMMTMGRRKIPAVLARTLTKVAYEVRDGELKLAREKFNLSARGSSLLAKPQAYTILVAHPDNLESAVVAKPKASELLLPHVRGDTITDKSSVERLKMRIDRGGDTRLAIPVAGSRTARTDTQGRVRKAWTPAAIYEKYGSYTKEHPAWKKTGRRSGASSAHGRQRRGRLFISQIGNVYIRAAKSGGALIRLYRLRSKGKLKARFTFVARAEKVAKGAITDKFRYVLDKEIRKSASSR
jgi:hypothetical protein